MIRSSLEPFLTVPTIPQPVLGIEVVDIEKVEKDGKVKNVTADMLSPDSMSCLLSLRAAISLIGLLSA